MAICETVFGGRTSDDTAGTLLVFLSGEVQARPPVAHLEKHMSMNQTELANRQPNYYSTLAFVSLLANVKSPYAK